MSQSGFGAIAGVDQGTISKWERGVLVPSQDELRRIRQYALDNNIPWEDSWFFEVPAQEEERVS